MIGILLLIAQSSSGARPGRHLSSGVTAKRSHIWKQAKYRSSPSASIGKKIRCSYENHRLTRANSHWLKVYLVVGLDRTDVRPMRAYPVLHPIWQSISCKLSGYWGTLNQNWLLAPLCKNGWCANINNRSAGNCYIEKIAILRHRLHKSARGGWRGPSHMQKNWPGVGY